MNGRITIELGGVLTPLTFGMLAIEEFGNRQANGGIGWSKLITDLIYSGYCNDEIVEGYNPRKSYREIAESVGELISVRSSVLGDVYKCFEESKAGEQLVSIVKKKVEVQPEKPKQKKKRTGTTLKDSPLES
ncbi:hypothetical protein [Pedobacter duraquae]|uniref:Uncharacterized protein n=1 Tax=Pedobacter duraquae TaxID=425511 RepID=A0A4R6IIS5_9SPHI|nr:hypothetical protein [Pedobacter duraquae]TDO21884.1 hypothetical protein CLV32_2992 [Pedobacter duraquae]